MYKVASTVRFQNSYELDPDATAICAWGGEFSYSRLDSLSSGFALQLLKEWSIRPDTIVPVDFEKSKWTAVAILDR
ncbi:hypothetical protein N7451_005298 [Penicillium sp. IBT 35674x]|nr:hypothetical protein N7451_005298 [Penicillium sp. IBT 35674x]